MSELFKDLIFKYLDLAEMSELFKDVIFKYLDLAEMSELLERKREASLNLGDVNKDDKLSFQVNHSQNY